MRTPLAIVIILCAAAALGSDDPLVKKGPVASKRAGIVSSNDLGHIHYPQRMPGAEVAPPAQTVFVDSYLPTPLLAPYQGILQRELFRQALLIAARERGCAVVTGRDMFEAQVGMVAEFLGAKPRHR